MILSCGETLIDFIPTQAGDGTPALRPAVGGSPGNVALTLARLAIPTGFIGGFSTDFFGERIVAHLAESGVSTRYMARSGRPSMLAFVDLEGEEPRYAFYDAASAPRNWRLEDLPGLGSDVTTLHFASLSLIRHPAAREFEQLMLREADRRIISFDPNIRAGLVEDEGDYRARLDAFFARAHVIKLSKADLDWIAPDADAAALASAWLSAEARLVLLTRGAEGATMFGRSASVTRPARPVKVADTVGAGDSIMGGLLAALAERGWLDLSRLGALTASELTEVLEFALAVAAITVSRIGADPPRRGEVSAAFTSPSR